MPFSNNAADNMWDYEDAVRRVTQQLFDPTQKPARRERNYRYRLGLLQLMDGLLTENPFDVAEGMDLIAAQFPRVERPDFSQGEK